MYKAIKQDRTKYIKVYTVEEAHANFDQIIDECKKGAIRIKSNNGSAVILSKNLYQQYMNIKKE